MDVRRTVGGLLVRDALLGRLLVHYADRLAGSAAGSREPDCFLVPAWSAGSEAAAAAGAEVLTVQVHIVGADEGRGRGAAAVLARLDEVLTGTQGAGVLTARRLGTSGPLADDRLGSVYRAATWEITPRPAAPGGAAPAGRGAPAGSHALAP